MTHRINCYIVLLMDEEIWKDIPGYEGRYQASTHGNIRSLRLLKPQITTGTGYPAVGLDQERFAVHTLVARTFIGPQPAHLCVNHLDSNRTNNRTVNLEYVTTRENLHHSFRAGNRKLYFTNHQMDRIARMFFEEGRSVSDIARQFVTHRGSEKEFKARRKQVLSVCTIWRFSQRPAGWTRGPYQRKLDYEKAAQIRQMYATGVTQTQIAKVFGCHPAHVSRVVGGLMWNPVDNSGGTTTVTKQAD